MPEKVPTHKVKKPKALSMSKKNPTTKRKMQMNKLSKKGKVAATEKPGTKGPKIKMRSKYGNKGGTPSRSGGMPTLRPKGKAGKPQTHADRALKNLASSEGW